ncbi:MAG TPA: glycoside hydrolase family 15 protein [Nitrolancea sp.]|nr:glycoside hydrolase family 15 protein [Nitrolancea sp.]
MSGDLRPSARINDLIALSESVYDACLLPNGCLVAAPSHLPIYPASAKSYLYCWPGRDLGFALVAMEALGREVREPLLRWIWERAEEFQSTGLIYEEYHPNGPRRGPEWQPDQAGTLLWALCRAPRTDDVVEVNVVRVLADGLANMWDGKLFVLRHRDLWERRFASPRHGSNFSYTLAATAKGLRLAGEVYNNALWRRCADEMTAQLELGWNDRAGHYLRRFGPVGDDPVIDASLIGLAWPFDVLPADERVQATITAIETRLLSELGVYRYLFDGSDGDVERVGAELRQGAGAWPLLTFWLAIVRQRLGDATRAQEIYRIGLDNIEPDGYIPEQVFPAEDGRIGVRPLLWSHMMFVLATLELGLLQER